MGYTFNEGRTSLASGGYKPLVSLPKHTFYFRSYYDLNRKMDLDLMIYYVDESKNNAGSSTPDIPDYTRVDLRYGWRPIKSLDVSLLLTNFLDACTCRTT